MDIVSEKLLNNYSDNNDLTKTGFSLVINNTKFDFKSIVVVGSVGKYFVNTTKKFFIKQDKKYNTQFSTIMREAYIYRLLKKYGFTWSLNYIDNVDNFLITEYIDNSEIINTHNIPSDYKRQIEKILSDMDKKKLRHNDLKIQDILVQYGRIIITDFAWASINNDFSCGQDNIVAKSKMHLNPNSKGDKFCILDKDIITSLDKLYSNKMKTISTSNRRNNKGSQSEIPSLRINNNNIIVDGYQKYTINTKNIIHRNKKINIVENILKSLINETDSITDIGCSSGLVCFIANHLKISKIYALDHDSEYLNVINTIINYFKFNNITPKSYCFGDMLYQSDIIVMLAIIHWIYSCTAIFGNFDKILNYINYYVNKYLIIEWVDNNDPAIKSLHHIDFNKNIHTAIYNKENFECSLKKCIGTIISTHEITPTRLIYVVKKYNIIL